MLINKVLPWMRALFVQVEFPTSMVFTPSFILPNSSSLEQQGCYLHHYPAKVRQDLQKQDWPCGNCFTPYSPVAQKQHFNLAKKTHRNCTVKAVCWVFFFHWLSIKTPHMCSFLTHLIFHCLAPGDVPCSCAQQVWKAPRRAFYLDSTLQTCLVFTGPNSYTGYKEASLFSVSRIMAQH